MAKSGGITPEISPFENRHDLLEILTDDAIVFNATLMIDTSALQCREAA
jgi:hypothetical protein